MSDTDLDYDLDGLTNVQEILTHGTDPTQPDTDDDGLFDGWEISNGYNPLVDNGTDADPNNNFDADPDGDGLVNYVEADHGNSASSGDSDGDSISDSAEIQQGSDPSDPSSTQAPPGGVVPVMVTFGDPSGSHSEKYQVRLIAMEDAQMSFHRTNRKYGQTQIEIFRVPRGTKFKVELLHAGTDPELDMDKPDYDYQLDIEGGEVDPDVEVITDDESGILGEHGESVEFFAEGKSADLYVAWLKSETFATHPANRERKKLGVGEEVILSLEPKSLPTPSWIISGNVGTSRIDKESGITTRLFAGERLCAPRVEATILNKKLNIDFNVIEPTGEIAERVRDLTIADGQWQLDSQQGVGMILKIKTLPDDVSFNNVEVIEIDKGTHNITGYFVDRNPKHEPNEEWIRLNQHNTLGDMAGFTRYPSPWSYGSYEFHIEVRWRVADAEIGEGGFLANRIQRATIHDFFGRSTIEKLQNSATRTPSP